MDILIDCTNCPHTNDIQCEVVVLEKLIYCTRTIEKIGTFTTSTKGELDGHTYQEHGNAKELLFVFQNKRHTIEELPYKVAL